MAGPDAGTAGSVEAGAPGKQKAGGIAGLFGMETDKAQGPSAAAYNDERNRADDAAYDYNKLSQGYTQNAPTIANQFQGQSRSAIGGNIGLQQGLADTLLHNNGEASQAQFQSNLDQGIAAQLATANSTAGGATALTGAGRSAALQAATMRSQGAAESARLGALEREAALNQAAGVYNNVGNQLQNQYGLEQGSAIAQAGLESQNQAQQNAMRLGYGSLGVQSRGQSLGALNDYTSANMGTQGLSMGLANQAGQAVNQAVGIGAGVAGTLLAGPAGGAVGGAVANGATGGSSGGVPPPHAAYGGAIGPAPNSIAAVYGQHVPTQAPAPRVATLADALAGIHELRTRLAGLEGRR